MLFSDLLNKNVEETNNNSYFGIEVGEVTDKDFEKISEHNFKEIGLLLEGDSLSEDLIDVLIDFSVKGTHLLLEVPFESNIDIKTCVNSANSMGFSVSLLLPKEINEENLQAYAEKLSEYFNEWVNINTYKTFIYPVAGYFQYLIQESLGYKPETITNDPYIEKNFVKPISIEQMDFIKDILKVTIYDVFDGKEGFETYAHSLSNAAINIVKDTINELKK